MDVAIKVENLNFSVGKKHILHDINLDIPKNSFTGILAPNGAGKTTLLKCFNGINNCTGNIFINGKDKNNFEDKELAQNISLMNQNTNLDFNFTCQEIVSLGRYPYLLKGHWAKVGDREIVEKYMRSTNTWELKDKNFTKLSGGQRQRVLFAKVLTQETDIILLDEPTASLDIYHQRQLMHFGKELTNQGKTVVIAIHDLNLAIQFCNHFILMKEGKVISKGDFQEVFTTENLRKTYHVEAEVFKTPTSNQYQLDIYESDEDSIDILNI